MLLVFLLFTILGTITDAIAAIIVFVPIILPAGKSLGIHPVHVGVVVVMTMALGLLALPYGLCTLIACGIAKYPVVKVLRILHVLMIAIALIGLRCAVYPLVCPDRAAAPGAGVGLTGASQRGTVKSGENRRRVRWATV